jgi:diguanylate cyclase (GGDEF)-like protein
MRERLTRFGNVLTSVCAGLASFVFTLVAFLMLKDLGEQIMASVTIGLFALAIVWLAYERPNSGQARAISALIDRLLAVRSGDLSSPSPPALRHEMPALAAAVDGLFEQVRSNIDNVSAMALYDPVTSLPNRIHFRREAERMLHEEGGDRRLALLFIDLDGFKEVNDSLGHAAGDQVLVLVANRLRQVAKAETKSGSLAQPLLARLAGDEFTMLFADVRDSREAERIARRALAALNAPYENSDQSIDMGASIGLALCPRHGTELTGLMKAADIAMYHAKASGRSQYCLYHPRLAAAFEKKSHTERALREALANDEFELAFQPQICARSGAVLAGEALIRWNHPSGEVRLAESFISVAEESSLIVDIGDWVIESVAAALRRWHDAGMTQRLAFNISARHFNRPDFFKRLRAAVARTSAPAWLLELEFTEAVAMGCSPATIAELVSLRTDGVSIALDDFGTGLSNLRRLKDMPLDRVKLDESLIREIDTSDSSRTIAAALIHLIHGLGYQVVGEGVERQEQFEVLRAIGCDAVQGYVFAEAMVEAEFLAWVQRRSKRLKTASA